MLIVTGALFLACILAEGFLTGRSLRELTPEQRAQLADAPKPKRHWPLLVALFVLWAGISLVRRQFMLPGMITLLALELALGSRAAFLGYRGYERRGIPRPFLSNYLVGRCLHLAGAAVFFTALVLYLRAPLGG